MMIIIILMTILISFLCVFHNWFVVCHWSLAPSLRRFLVIFELILTVLWSRCFWSTVYPVSFPRSQVLFNDIKYNMYHNQLHVLYFCQLFGRIQESFHFFAFLYFQSIVCSNGKIYFFSINPRSVFFLCGNFVLCSGFEVLANVFLFLGQILV